MRSHRFGREIKLPATNAIKHQIRMRMAQYEINKTEIELKAEVLRGLASEELPVKSPIEGMLTRVRSELFCSDFGRTEGVS